MELRGLIRESILHQINSIEESVDKSISNMLFYHGTSSNFSSFKNEFIEKGTHGAGFYFTPNIDAAKSYGDRVITVKLDIKNPLTLSGLSSDQDLRDMFPKAHTENDLTFEIIKHGYDGVVVYGNSKRTGTYIREVVVFYPKQIEIMENI